MSARDEQENIMLSRRVLIRIAGRLASFGVAFLPTLAAAQISDILNFSTPDHGWIKDGQGFHAPPSGNGPISYDKAHPVLRTAPNNRGIAVTAPLHVADLSNPVLKPWVAQQMKQDDEAVIGGQIRFNPRSYCRPTGVPHFLLYGGQEPLYFVQSAHETLIINQADTQVRHVYINVPHSAQPVISFYGESVGHYEGSELVVDTLGLNDKPALDDYGTPHTNQLHVVERFKLIDGGKTLQATFTVEDPSAFNAPWSGIALYHRSPGILPLTEEPCAENNLGHPGMPFDIPMAERSDF
jgi:hypothetical protein